MKLNASNRLLTSQDRVDTFYWSEVQTLVTELLNLEENSIDVLEEILQSMFQWMTEKFSENEICENIEKEMITWILLLFEDPLKLEWFICLENELNQCC